MAVQYRQARKVAEVEVHHVLEGRLHLVVCEEAAACRGTPPVVYTDETGYRIGGMNAWAWAFVTKSVSFICILWGRGYAKAASLPGHDYSGTLMPDGWKPYRRFKRATLGTCEATNWPAEHERRVVARIRKSCAGNRTERGARTTSVLLGVLRTAIKLNVHILNLVAAIMRDPVPHAHL
jgi:hypothetical protein